MVSFVEMPRKKSVKKTKLVAFRIELDLLNELRATPPATEFGLNDTQLLTQAVRLLIHEYKPAPKGKKR